MKQYDLTMTPSNKSFPVIQKTSTLDVLSLGNIEKDTYLISVKSPFYDDFSSVVTITAPVTIKVNLILKEIITWVKHEPPLFETLPRGEITIEDPSMEPGQTRVVAGTDGEKMTTWEDELVNGVLSGRKRNYVTIVTKEPVPDKKFVASNSIMQGDVEARGSVDSTPPEPTVTGVTNLHIWSNDGGVRVWSKVLKDKNTDYTLAFKYKLSKGQLQTIGGYVSGAFLYQGKVFIDGYNEGANWSSGGYYVSSDFNEHTVVYQFNSTGDPGKFGEFNFMPNTGPYFMGEIDIAVYDWKLIKGHVMPY